LEGVAFEALFKENLLGNIEEPADSNFTTLVILR
jgi:hypothetical protein